VVVEQQAVAERGQEQHERKRRDPEVRARML
jgi:hypothetical protein